MTDGVSAFPTFDVPIRREQQIMFKNDVFRGIRSTDTGHPAAVVHESGEFEVLSGEDMEAFRNRSGGHQSGHKRPS